MILTEGLGRYILVPLLSEWLSLTDFVLYDSAICCVYRQIHLMVIIAHSDQFQSKLLNLSSSLPLCYDVLKWFERRKWSIFCAKNLALQCDSWFDAVDYGDIVCNPHKLYVSRSKLSSSQALKMEVFPSFVNLTELNCDNDSALRHILKHSRSLKHCRLTLRKQREQLISLLLRSNPHLGSLHIKAVSGELDSHPFKFSKWFIPALIAHGGCVTSTSFNQCGPIKPRYIQMFALHCRQNLREFSFSGFTEVNLRAFLWYKGSQLRALNISHCTAVTNCLIDELVDVCTLLEDFNVSFCTELSDFAITRIVTLKNLHRLTLQGLPLLTDDFLTVLLPLKDQLESLSLRRHPLLTATGLLSLGNLCGSCTSLSLQELPRVVHLLPTILALLTNLTCLDLSHNKTLTDTDLSNALSSLNCRFLIALSVGGCELLTDRALNMIAEKCWYLERLSVHSCYLISDASVLSLLSDCKRLKSINLTYTAITETARNKMQAMNRRLRIETNLFE